MHTHCIFIPTAPSMPHTIVLAYSGGLDTSVIVPWLKERYQGARVICFAADVGQGEGELAGVREKALASGADDCHIEDLRRPLIEDFIWPTLRAGAIYGRKYLLGTAVARVGDPEPRGRARLRRRARHPGGGDAREDLLARPQPLAPLARGGRARGRAPRPAGRRLPAHAPPARSA